MHFSWALESTTVEGSEGFICWFVWGGNILDLKLCHQGISENCLHHRVKTEFFKKGNKDLSYPVHDTLVYSLLTSLILRY